MPKPHRTAAAVLLTLFLAALPARAAQKLCYHTPQADHPPYLIVPVDSGEGDSVLDRNKAVRKGRIRVAETAGDGVLFARRALVPGDCLLLDAGEKTELFVAHEGKGLPEPGFFKRFSRGVKRLFGGDTEFEKKSLYPSIGLAAVSGEKFYGWLEEPMLEVLFPTPAVPPLGVTELLDYSEGARDLVLIYALCPKDRESLCTMRIRDRGEWLEDPASGAPFQMKVLARSRRETGDPDKSCRINPGGDTPQGIYVLWASMYSTEKVFGGEPRVDIDAQKPPLNSGPDSRYARVLPLLVPRDHWNDYWLNEWPLAYHLGRVLLRIHGNSIDPETPSTFQPEDSDRLYRPTSGCINTGDRQREFLDTMVSLGVFKADKVLIPEGPRKHYWERAAALGKAFMIVRDVD